MGTPSAVTLVMNTHPVAVKELVTWIAETQDTDMRAAMANREATSTVVTTDIQIPRAETSALGMRTAETLDTLTNRAAVSASIREILILRTLHIRLSRRAMAFR